jgi:hypothetical protein
MSRFVIIAMLASAAPVTFLYEDAEKAWAKVRTLQRTGASFEIKDGRTEMPLSVVELEAMLRRK